MKTAIFLHKLSCFSGLLFLILMFSEPVQSQTPYLPTARYTFDVNNISAVIKSSGQHFNIPDAGEFESSAGFEVPKGSGHTTIFTFSLWLGGLDDNDQLHLAAVRFGQVGAGYMTGPLSIGSASTTPAIIEQWDHIWVVDRSDIMALINSNGAQIAPSLLAWPAHGDTTQGQDFYLAPFYDFNGDGRYNPHDRDYPLIKGDRAAFFIFNDFGGTADSQSQGFELGMEVQGMVYGFNAPQDSMLNNTLFMNYKLINRSSNNYHDVYLGLWADTDIGYAYDDYIGCDVQRSSFYGYNSTNMDGYGENWAYGNYPPAQAITILGGPTMDADLRDNPHYQKDMVPSNPGYCDLFINSTLSKDQFAINGSNFGDDIIDNERLGMTGFLYHNNNFTITGDPGYVPQYYNYMRGVWKDDSPIRFGGNGHYLNGGTGPDCRFMFPGTSDPCAWGTQGIDTMPIWTETTAGNVPADRRGLGSSGPFTFNAGAVQELDFGFITIFPDTANGLLAVDDLSGIDSIINMYHRQVTSYGQPFMSPLAITEPNDFPEMQWMAYPNPATQYVNIKTDGTVKIGRAELYNMLGKLIKTETNNSSPMQINVNNLPQGIYFIKLFSEKSQYLGTCKIIKQ